MNKKPITAFTIADSANLPLAKKMINSLRKFHTEEELPMYIVTGKELEHYLKEDPQFFYRSTPVVANKLLKDYETVIKLDADQIFMGDISHILSLKDYDVGTVLNYNRTDPKTYGVVTVFNIDPQRYFNCGFVVMKNHEFVKHWLEKCYSEHFERLQYREQDLLNILLHYGNYNYICYDIYDRIRDYSAWHGLLNKGEGVHMKLVDGQVILPKGEDNYPAMDKIVKVFHFAGGKGENKNNYRIWFNEELISHIDWLVSGENDKKETKKA